MYVRGQLLLDVDRGREAHALLRAGALNGLSIGYKPKTWEYDEDTKVTTLTEVDLWECSVVTFPANGLARVSGVKAKDRIDSLGDWRSFETYLRDEGGFSRSAAAAMTAAARRLSGNERDARDAIASIKSAAERAAALLKT